MHPTFAMTTSGVPCVNRTRSRHRATSASSPRSTRETSHCSASHSGQCWLRSDATRSALGVAAATVRRQSGYARSDASKARPTPWPASARTTVLAQSLTRPPALASEEENARVAVASGAKPSPQGTNVDARREKRGRARTSAGARAARRSTAGRDMVRCAVREWVVGRNDANVLSWRVLTTSEVSLLFAKKTFVKVQNNFFESENVRKTSPVAPLLIPQLPRLGRRRHGPERR